MKTFLKIIVVFAAINLMYAAFPKQASAQGAYVSFQVFYDQLSPYGRWVAYPHHGYVWVPNAEPDFTPYATNGYWEYTDYGWTWVSDYPWGWAPFHYGRWDFDNYYGWFWVPDNVWGPAWVVWRQGNGCLGWAPMGPGVTINVVFGKGYYMPQNHWIFVNDRDFNKHDLSRYYLNRDRNRIIINNSRIIDNTYLENGKRAEYFSGPDRNEVQRITGKPVRRLAVNIADKPEKRNISNERIDIYKPQILKKDDTHNKYSPKPIEKWNRQTSSNRNKTNNSNSYQNINNNNKEQHQNNNIRSNKENKSQQSDQSDGGRRR